MQKAILATLISVLAITGVTLFYTDNSVTLQLAGTESDAIYKQYTAWKQTHGKNTNGSEDEFRFRIFSENLNFINKHNNQNKKLTLGLTKFADLTNAEFRDLMTTEIEQAPATNVTVQASESNADFQDIDWVSKGAVTDVKNQGSCGACWAFAAVGSLEGLQYIQTGISESLSNQQVLSCVSKLVSGGCRGGNAYYAYKYVAKSGIETEASYPYVDGSSAVASACQYEKDLVVYQNKDGGQVQANSPAQINQQLQQQPLAVGVDAGSIYFQLYSQGIITSENCGTALNHQITLVGYSSSDNTWTVKNSWGTGWGNKGFAQILNTEGNGICGINMDVQYPTA